MSGPNKNTFVVVGLGVVGVLLLLMLAGNAGQNNENMQEVSKKVVQEEQNEQVKMPESTSADQKMAEGDVKAFTLEAGAFYYKPNVLNVKVGDKVKITINSKDMMHDFNIEEFKAKSVIAISGESASVEFVASKKGTFEFYCSVGQHRANGQVGSLIVE